MNILLLGVSCVGKTTIGTCLAENLGYKFFDLDREIYALDQTPIGGYTAEYKNAFRTSVLPYNLGKLIEYCGSHTGAICTLSGSPVTGMNDAAKTLLINTCADLL